MRLAAMIVLAAALVACSGEAPNQATHGVPVVTHEPDAATGRTLFVEKGCVICHSVNGVGGKAAPVLDAEIGLPPIDPLDFAARIWRGAPAMVELQSMELGYTIDLSAADIAHLAAFAGDREEQKKLTEDALSEELRNGLLDQGFWEVEDWSEFLEDGQEGWGEPSADEAGEADRPPQP